jgi:sugar-specific transcriptional regulator TrmB
MDRISSRLIRALKTLGLSDYESRVYSALVYFDYAEAKEIIDFLDISKPSVYESLRSLEDMGFVQLTHTKPTVYKAVPPEMAVNLLMEKHKKAAEEALEELEKLEMTSEKETSDNAFLSLYGNASVDYKIRDMLRHVSSNMFAIISDKYLHYFTGIDGRGLKIKLLVLSTDISLKSKIENEHTGEDIKVYVITPQLLMSMIGALKLPSTMSDNDAREIYGMMDYESLLILETDDSEFLYIPPLKGMINALNTSNKAMVLMMKMVYEGWLKKIESMS